MSARQPDPALWGKDNNTLQRKEKPIISRLRAWKLMAEKAEMTAQMETRKFDKKENREISVNKIPDLFHQHDAFIWRQLSSTNGALTARVLESGGPTLNGSLCCQSAGAKYQLWQMQTLPTEKSRIISSLFHSRVQWKLFLAGDIVFTTMPRETLFFPFWCKNVFFILAAALTQGTVFLMNYT